MDNNLALLESTSKLLAEAEENLEAIKKTNLPNEVEKKIEIIHQKHVAINSDLLMEKEKFLRLLFKLMKMTTSEIKYEHIRSDGNIYFSDDQKEGVVIQHNGNFYSFKEMLQEKKFRFCKYDDRSWRVVREFFWLCNHLMEKIILPLKTVSKEHNRQISEIKEVIDLVYTSINKVA